MAVWLKIPKSGFVAMIALIAALFWVALFWATLFWPSQASAQALQSYQTSSSFDDVRFELTNAIIERGLKVQSNGNVAAMLERTGTAAGSSKLIYKKAEYFSFCSVKLSRAMMEADPANVGYCPFVIFLYVAVAKPDEVTVGYQTHPMTGNAASIKAFVQIDKLLDGIAKAATQ